MDVVGYTRGTGAERERQRSEILRLAQEEGFNVVAVHGDELAPDRASGRAGALAALSERQAEALVVADAGSLGPRLSDAAELVRQGRGSGWALLVADPAIDSRQAAGRAALCAIEGLAASEWAWRSARTKAPLDSARRSGVHLGRPYSIPTELRQRILDDAAAGRGASEIARALNDEGVPQDDRERLKTPPLVSRGLRAKFRAGERTTWGGVSGGIANCVAGVPPSPLTASSWPWCS